MIDLTSDNDDDVCEGKCAKVAAPIVEYLIDSDDDQPLEALKLELKQALHSRSISTSQTAPDYPTMGANKPGRKLTSKKAAGYGAAPAAGQAAAAVPPRPASTLDQQAAAATTRGFLSSPLGKETAGASLGSLGVDAAGAGSQAGRVDDCDLDNWCLEPLQRRLNRRAGRAGAAAPSGSQGAAAAGSQGDEGAVGVQQHLWHQPQEQLQQQQEQRLEQQQQRQKQEQEQQQRQRRQDCSQGDQDGSDSSPYSHAAAGASRKRQRPPAESGSGLDNPADSDPPYHPAADDLDDGVAAAAAAGAAGAKRPRAPRGSSKSGGAAGSSKVRLTAEERAAQKADEKARKNAEKIAAKLARQSEAEATKAAKRFDTFSARKQHGNFHEYESVLVMDSATAASALGLALSTELDRRKTIAWQVVPQLPLSGRWAGCSCFCFKRRKMCELDEHALKTAVSTQLHTFREDVAPPYVQLVFQEASTFLTELQRDRLASLLAAVAAGQPGCTLGLLVLGLKSHVQRLDNQQMRQGGASCWDWRRVNTQLLELHVATPGLQLRLLSKPEEAAAHIIHTARALGQQPYSVENQLEACGGAGPGAASKAASAAMVADLGPTTREFAVNTLGKMHSMGGNKAWAVAKAYPSIGALIAGFERAAAAPGGAPALLLQDLLEPAGTGKAKARRVGPAMSRRLHLLLTCEDPDTIVEGDGDAD